MQVIGRELNILFQQGYKAFDFNDLEAFIGYVLPVGFVTDGKMSGSILNMQEVKTHCVFCFDYALFCKVVKSVWSCNFRRWSSRTDPIRRISGTCPLWEFECHPAGGPWDFKYFEEPEIKTQQYVSDCVEKLQDYKQNLLHTHPNRIYTKTGYKALVHSHGIKGPSAFSIELGYLWKDIIEGMYELFVNKLTSINNLAFCIFINS